MDISVRPLRESDLPIADRIFRLAFGTFLGLPEPIQFWADRDYVRTRWRADPSRAFGAEMGGELVGSNFVTNWGSVGFFGPLTVRPDLWDHGIAKRLLGRTMDQFATWGTKHAGLFTFAHSPKHIGLYQKFGFWPRFLTAIMAKSIAQVRQVPHAGRYSEVPERQRGSCLNACHEVTDAIYEGLNMEHEIRAVDRLGLGDTVLLWEQTRLVGFAVCHCGPGTEAGNGRCYLKFASVRPGPTAGGTFERLLDACEALAASKGLSHIEVGVNLARHKAYEKIIARGFRPELQGVAMHRPNAPGYNHPEAYVIDDWR